MTSKVSGLKETVSHFLNRRLRRTHSIGSLSMSSTSMFSALRQRSQNCLDRAGEHYRWVGIAAEAVPLVPGTRTVRAGIGGDSGKRAQGSLDRSRPTFVGRSDR